MSTSYGKNLKISIYGASHAEEIGIVASGLPEGFVFDLGELSEFMARRAPGSNNLSTPRKEADTPVFEAGVDMLEGNKAVLSGEELRAVIKNTSARSSDYSNLTFVPRPSHADFAARMKYGEKVDLRGGGHFSGRLTAPMCIVGGICLQYLKAKGIRIAAHLYSIGEVKDTPFDLAKVTTKDFDLLEQRSDFPVLDSSIKQSMIDRIGNARENGDSVGGIIECAVLGIPAGLGEHMFDGVENRISSIIFSIPAVKAIEFGNGFECASLSGSENNDPFITDGENIYTATNNCGGILGGMTNGMPLVFRSAMKPTPSIFKEQDSVDMVSMKPVKLSIKGRHDPCVALRAVPVFEAAAAIAVCDMLFDTLN